jgi:hypothetical protein
MDRLIDEAAARGAFDHLEGEGKPLDLRENPYVPAEWRLAFKLLKDNQVVPEFVERRRAIEKIRAEMQRETLEAPMRRLAQRLALEIEALNRCLARENEFMRGSLQMAPIDVEAEVARQLRSAKR